MIGKLCAFLALVSLVCGGAPQTSNKFIATLSSQFLGKNGKVHKERGYEDHVGFICKRLNSQIADNDAHCDAIFQNLTETCRKKTETASCFRNLSTGKTTSFVSFKAKTIQSVEDKLNHLGACCEYVEVDQQVSANGCPATIPWNLDRIDEGRKSDSIRDYYPAARGGNSIVFVIDTGIYSGHSEFQTASGSKVVGGFNVFNTSAPASDGNGHGTHVAGTAAGLTYGVAKDALLYAVKVLDNSGSGSTSGVIAGVNHMINKCKPAAGDSAHPGAGWFAVPAAAGGGYRRCVGSMSLGGGFVQSMNDAVQKAVGTSNIPVAVAAGNDGTSASSTSPASTPLAITVGASDSSDVRASFSNYGKFVDIYAPGVAIISAGISSSTATTTMSGTSMATPHVSGAVALLLTMNTSMKATTVVSTLLQTGIASFVSGPDGCMNALLQVIRAGSNTCDGDATARLQSNASWAPSPCGTCSGVASACSSTPTCTAAAPRAAGCDCLAASDCKSGICDNSTAKCTAPPSSGNTTTTTAPPTTTPPPATCSTTNPCSTGDTVCDSVCCQAYGTSYYSAYRSNGYCMCQICSIAAAAAAAPSTTAAAPGNGYGRKRAFIENEGVGAPENGLHDLVVGPVGLLICAVLLIGGATGGFLASRRRANAGHDSTVGETQPPDENAV